MKKPMTLWKLILTDILLSLMAFGSFMLYYYIIPQPSSNKGTKISSTTENNISFGNKKGMDRSNTNISSLPSSEEESQTITSAEKKSEKLESYQDENISLTIGKTQVGSGDDKITYYIADIYVTDLKYLKTAFAFGSYGKNLRDSVINMAKDNQSVLAISGDFYGNTDAGVVIRNGVLYRSKVSETDICVLYTDGTMKTYSPDEFDGDAVIKKGAWHAWSFGPSLLDSSGNVLSDFNSTSYINKSNPRCAIGCVDSGHYVFAVVDGRNDGYSKGATLSQLAQIMSDAGCNCAYNLDGGKSSAMVFQGAYVNQPADGGRTISDIIYVGQ